MRFRTVFAQMRGDHRTEVVHPAAHGLVRDRCRNGWTTLVPPQPDNISVWATRPPRTSQARHAVTIPALSVPQHLDAALVCGILHTAFHMNVVPTMAIGRNLVSYELAYARAAGKAARDALDEKSAVGCC